MKNIIVDESGENIYAEELEEFLEIWSLKGLNTLYQNIKMGLLYSLIEIHINVFQKNILLS